MAVEEDVGSAEILQELYRLIQCKTLQASDRNRQFLRYVVTETLEGRGSRLKAYNIATSVFGRGSNFNPQQDAIVRIEAGRLRRALEHYYLTDGLHDPIRITVPIGSYLPAFEKKAPIQGGARLPDEYASTSEIKTLGCRPSILVTCFETDGDQTAFPNFARSFLRRIVVELGQFAGLQVYWPERIAELIQKGDDASLSEMDLGDYILTGGAALSDHSFSVEAVLVNVRSNRCVWAQSFDRRVPQHGMVPVRNEVAANIASALGLFYGCVAQIGSRGSIDQSSTITQVDRQPRQTDIRDFELARTTRRSRAVTR